MCLAKIKFIDYNAKGDTQIPPIEVDVSRPSGVNSLSEDILGKNWESSEEMSVTDRNIVDALTLEKDIRSIVLSIFDHFPWGEEINYTHLLILN